MMMCELVQHVRAANGCTPTTGEDGRGRKADVAAAGYHNPPISNDEIESREAVSGIVLPELSAVERTWLQYEVGQVCFVL